MLDVLDLNDIEICNSFELAHSFFAEGANAEASEIFETFDGSGMFHRVS